MKRPFQVIPLAAWLGFTLAAQAADFSDWNHRMPITVAGYPRPDTLTNFPVLLTFAEGSNGFHYADLASPADAADLRFSSADGETELPYELEDWNTTGVSLVWVQVERLSAGTNIWAYWNKSGQPVKPYTTNGAVWADGFKAVWHLGDGGATRRESSTNRYATTVDATGVTATNAGPIGKADLFTGTATGSINNPPASGGINCGNISITGSETIEMWLQATNLSQRRNPFNKAYGGEGTMTIETSGIINFFYGTSGADSGTFQTFGTPAGTVTANKWIHLALVRDLVVPRTLRWYVNGVQVAFATASYAAATASANTLRLGKGYVYCHNGMLDEVRMSTVPRSSNWVWACFMNQASNRTFLAYGDAELNNPNTPRIDNTGGATNITDDGAWITANLTSTGSAPTTVWAYWDTNNWGPNRIWANGQDLGVQPVTTGLAWQATGLPANTDCHYTFYASNAFGESWAKPSVTFTTLGPPLVDNGPGAADITYHTARLQGALLDGATALVAAAWGETAGTLTNLTPFSAVSEGAFSLPLAGLADNTAFFYRCYATNGYGEAWAGSIAAFTTLHAQVVWTGAGTNGLASNPANWSGGLLPLDGARIRLDDASQKNLTWDLTNLVLQSWEQTAAYTGVVTIATKYPGKGPLTNLLIAGDCTLAGGVLTHPANTGGAVPVDRLKLTVDGDFTLGPAASIQLTGRGYAASQGPGAGLSLQRSAISYGASHGGRGAHGGLGAPSATYDSIVAPTNLGSGCHAAGGGNLELQVGGAATVNGAILADGGFPISNYGLNPGSAGGTVAIRAGSLTGTGSISAKGAGGYFGGGGGRIALAVTQSESFGTLTNVNAQGGVASTLPRGAAGTVYRQTMSQAEGAGAVVVDNGNIGATAYTPVPWDLQPPPAPVDGSELLEAALIVTNGGRVLVNNHLRLRDLEALPAGTLLALNTHSLYLAAEEHALGGGTIVSNAGRLVWADGPTHHYLAVASDPHGSAATELSGWYPSNTTVTVGATPESGYNFVRWDGDVPDAVRSNASVGLVMDDTRSVRAIFGSADPAARTWLGLINSAATNPANWYPPVVPAEDDRIVLDESASRQQLSFDYLYSQVQSPLIWDLDIRLSSWFQAGFSNLVTIQTRYPDVSPFTNLLIAGDCVISNGSWTHVANTGVTSQYDRLSVSVAGAFTLGSDAEINLTGRGFVAGRGPGAGNGLSRTAAGLGVSNGVAASHGGRGAHGWNGVPRPCYTPFMTPTNLGSGASGSGGGALRMDVLGLATVNGAIRANGPSTADGAATETPGGSGGSVYLIAGSLAGSGSIQANGASGYWGGGGGRVAVYLRESDSFGNVGMTAYGGYQAANASSCGGAGTVYREGASDAPGAGSLTVNNNGYAVPFVDVYAECPSTLDASLPAWSGVLLTVTNRAALGLTGDVTVRDLFLRTNTPARLYLKGSTLRVRAPFHRDWGHDAWVVAEGGRILWPATGTLLLIR
jgi:hypothetical protein